jgi:hypothetical protein
MKKIFIALLASTLFACGGGSSERDTDLTKYTPENVPEHLREDFEAMLLQEHFEAASAIHGLFKIEIDGDETYVLIPTNSSSLSGYDGFSITAYNYMGDVFDASGSCYLPPDSDGLNWVINTGTAADGIGTKFKYLNRFETTTGNNEFVADIHGGQLVYEVESFSSKLVKVTYNGQTSFDGNLWNAEQKLILSNDKQPWMMIEHVETNQCRGMPAKVAGNAFVGLFDTSENLYGGYHESYLYLSETGVIETWDYMGNTFLTENLRNCYKKSHFFNSSISGSAALYNQQENYLYITPYPSYFELRWYLNDAGVVESVGAPDADDGVDRVESYYSSLGYLGITAKRADVLIEDIRAMECAD